VYFYSDNTAPACPEIIAAIVQANEGMAQAYGDDAWTGRLNETLRCFFETDLRAFVVGTGTAANSLGLATVTPPYGAIFTHRQSHVLRDECGAPEFFTGGAQQIPVAGADGKMTVESLAAELDSNVCSVHTVQPAAVSLTQATELGTVYRPSEVAELSALARRQGLCVHMDGTRLANAIAFLECHPGDVTWRSGVDVLSFGATKNGALAAEAVIFFNPELARDFELRRKRAGHLISKSRYVAAQLIAYLDTGVWRRNAQRTNALARQLAASAKPFLVHPVESNQLFVRLDAAAKRTLRDAGFEFFDWGARHSGHARFVVSWDQAERDVHALCSAFERLTER
jgi:threonine aldolase